MAEKIKSTKSAATLQPSLTKLPDTGVEKRSEPSVINKTQPLNENVETAWEEVKDVFKSTTGNKSWMPGKPFTKAELSTFINEPVKQVNSNQVISLKEVQKNIQELKATHTHGS